MGVLSRSSMAEGQNGKSPRFSFPVHFGKWDMFRFFFVAIVLGVCNGQEKNYFANEKTRSCICEGDFNATTDYFPDKISADFSTRFTVEYKKSYKILHDKKTDKKTYLVMCGAEWPADIPADAQRVTIPIETAGISSSTHFHYFEYINQRSSLTYYNSYEQYITNPCMQKRAADEKFKTKDDFAITEADIDFYFGGSAFGLPEGIPSYVIDSATEPSVFARSEWVELISVFFNREKAAKEIVGYIEARYNCHKAKMASKPKKKASFFTFRNYNLVDYGQIANFTNDPTCSTVWDQIEVEWEKCGGEDPYLYCDVFTDAGFEVVSGNSTNITKLADTIADVDVILFYGNFSGSYYLMPDSCQQQFTNLLKDSKAYKNDEFYDIYKTTSSGGTDFFEGMPAEPDLFLLDLIAIYNSTEGIQENERKFLRKRLPTLEPEIVLTAADCVNVDAPLYTNWKSEACNEESPDVVVDGLEDVDAAEVCPPTFRPTTTPTAAPSVGNNVVASFFTTFVAFFVMMRME